MDYNKLLKELKDKGLTMEDIDQIKKAIGESYMDGWNKGFEIGKEEGFTDGQNNMLEAGYVMRD